MSICFCNSSISKICQFACVRTMHFKIIIAVVLHVNICLFIRFCSTFEFFHVQILTTPLFLSCFFYLHAQQMKKRNAFFWPTVRFRRIPFAVFFWKPELVSFGTCFFLFGNLLVPNVQLVVQHNQCKRFIWWSEALTYFSSGWVSFEARSTWVYFC